MRHMWKAVLTIFVVLLVAGIALTVVSALTGGSFASIKTNVAIRDYEEDFSGAGVDELELHIGAGSLKIVEGDDFRVEARNIAEEYFTCKLDGKKLVVSENWSNNSALNLARGLNLLDYRPEIIVYLPEGFEAKTAVLEMAAGRCDIERLHAGSIGITLAAGECVIDSLEAQEMDVEIAAGSLTVYSLAVDKCKTELSAGGAYLGGTIREEASVNCAAGRIELQLAGKQDDYSFDSDVGVGTVTIGGRSYGGVASAAVLEGKSGAARIDLECTAGEIVVGFTG